MRGSGTPAIALIGAAMLAGCTPALRQPTTVADLVAAPDPSSADPATLLAIADERFALRTPADVRSAVDAWLAAAATESDRTEGLIGAARGSTWLATHEPEAKARSEAARQAVQSAQVCLERAPGSADCSYWLAVGLGVQARERPTTALDGLPRIVRLLHEVAEASPELEHAGPHRVLALVFLRAPGWPRGPGDPDAALEQALQAVELEPDYPPNQLCLGEALRAVDRQDESREAYRRAADLARAAEARGEPEAASWLAEAMEALDS